MKAKRLAALVLVVCLILAVGTSMMRTVASGPALDVAASMASNPSGQPRSNFPERTPPNRNEASQAGRPSTNDVASIESVSLPDPNIDLDDSASFFPVAASQNLTTVGPADADWMAESNQNNTHLGYSVATAGDVNGDGYDDVIVGAPSYNYEHLLDAGAAFVWYGSALGLGTNGSPANADWKVLTDNNDALGRSVGSAGDVNGDGYDDVIVGAPGFRFGELNLAGAALVWYGSPTGLGGDGTPDGADWAAHGNQFAAGFGKVVGTAGDVNGDGYDDVIVGSYDYDNNEIGSAGAALVWYGSAMGMGFDGTFANADWKVISDQESAVLGFSAGTAGDVNGDGYDEVIIGAHGYDQDQFVQPEGAALVWYGSEGGLGPDGTLENADWMAVGDQSAANYGISVGTAGDVNGDLYDDVIIGATGYDTDQIDKAGAAFVWHGSAAGLGDNGSSDNADWTAVGDQYNGLFGWSVGTAGDVSGDGYADVIVGTHMHGEGVGGYLSGIAYIFHGSAAGLLPPSLAWSVEPDEPIQLGISSGTAGDVNGDDNADVIIGAINYRSSNDESREGAAFVFHGQSQPRFLLDISGQTTAAPGQTVDYAITYANFLTTTVKNTVLVLELPYGSEYVNSTAGGIYWPERHQVFWKLGDLDPGEAGQLSARGQFEWGLPLGTSVNAYVKLAGTDWGQDGLDVDPYLFYVPREILGLTPLSNQELLSELVAHPDMNTIYTQAIADGFILGGAAHITITNHSPIVQVTLLHEERSEVMDISRDSESIQATTFGPTFYAIQDRTGGMILDFQMGSLSSWGSWTSADASFRTECSLTVSDCITNFIMDNAPIWFISNLSKSISVALSSWDCLTGMAGNDTNLAKCFIALAKKKVLGELVDINEAINKCEDNPLEYTCTSSKKYCDRDKTNPIVFLGFADSIKTLECDSNCRYKWPPTPDYGPQGKVCKECPLGPVFLEPDECCGGTCDNQSSLTCLTAQETCTACATSECEIQPAHDPNAKFGTEGDVLPGQTLTYTITYENEGEGRAYGVYIEDELDEDLDDSTLTVNSGEYLTTTRTIIWDIGELDPAGDPGSSGVVTFTVTVSQGLPGGTVISNEAVVHFPSASEQTPTGAVVNVVVPVVAIPQQVETTYAKAVSITLAGKDVSSAPLTYMIVENPNYGELSGSPPNLIYTPMDNFTGPDRFSFKVFNGLIESRPADVTIMVHPSADDETAPQVLWTSPGDGETIAHPAATSIITVTVEPVYPPSLLVKFSEPLDPATVTAANIQLEVEGGLVINATPIYDEWSNWLTIVIREPWQAVEYTVTLTTGLNDASGNALEADYTWSFSVAASDNNIYIPLVAK